MITKQGIAMAIYVGGTAGAALAIIAAQDFPTAVIFAVMVAVSAPIIAINAART